jgi:Cu2+-containing amine oxidase
VPWLLKSREGSLDPLDRRGTALISLKLEHKTVYTEYVVSLSAKSVIKTRTTEDTDHAPFDVDEMLLAEQILLKDPEFIKVVDKLKLPQGAQILADSWPVSVEVPVGDGVTDVATSMVRTKQSITPDGSSSCVTCEHDHLRSS